MLYQIETAAYNPRRYGRPWIARVVQKDPTAKAEFEWGNFEGRPGEEGRLYVEAEPGSLVAWGQKDVRKGRGGVSEYLMAMPNGALWGKGLETEAKAKDWARKGWRAYAEWRLTDPELPEAYRVEAERMLAAPASGEVQS